MACVIGLSIVKPKIIDIYASCNSLKRLVVVVYHTNSSLIHSLHFLVVWFTTLTI